VVTKEKETLLAPVKEAKEVAIRGRRVLPLHRVEKRNRKRRQNGLVVQRQLTHLGEHKQITYWRLSMLGTILIGRSCMATRSRLKPSSWHDCVMRLTRIRSLPLRALAVQMVDWMLPALPLSNMTGCTMLSTRS